MCKYLSGLSIKREKPTSLFGFVIYLQTGEREVNTSQPPPLTSELIQTRCLRSRGGQCDNIYSNNLYPGN